MVATGDALVGGGNVLMPDDPGAADRLFDVDSSAARHAISPFVYGHNAPQWSGRGAHLTLGRSGGNRYTAYNWENNASNAGEDYFNQNDDHLESSDLPAEAVRAQIAAAFAAGAAQLVTVPIQGYVAADKDGGGDVNQTPNYLQVRFHRSVAQKTNAFTMNPSSTDNTVYQDEFVNWLETTFPMARSDPRRTIFYCLDNEPDLWSYTHPRIHSETPTYAEVIGLNIEYAGAIKDVAPDALVFGFVSYGWEGFVSLQGAPDAAGRDFLEVYLDALSMEHTAQGRRLIDVLDLHWYPEASANGTRVTETDASPAVAAARIQAPRSLWDPTYTEDSWIAQWGTQGPIRLLPRLREKIADHYPGTRLALTEYSYGGGGHISGGIAQAEVLGIFGREDIFAANFWPLEYDTSYQWAGFDIFRNYDGAGGGFGDISIAASTDDDAASSIYASVDGDDAGRMVLVVINKHGQTQTAGIRIHHTRRLRQAAIYQLTAATAAVEAAGIVNLSLTNALLYEMPAMSVSVLVLTD